MHHLNLNRDFEGNPGTGKTTVARILSSLFYYLDILPTQNVKFVDRSDLVGSYIGHTEGIQKKFLNKRWGAFFSLMKHTN